VLVGILGSPWRAAVAELSRRLPVAVPVRCVAIGAGCERTDLYGDWRVRSEVDEDGCVLVRPDRVVAWRSKGLVDDPAAKLTEVLKRILALE
jgi:hypothetical protein